jgi:hypothetical protein
MDIQDYPFLSGMKDSHLRQLYKEVRAELKSRNMLTYDAATQSEDVSKFYNRPERKIRKVKPSKGIVISGRNNVSAGDYGNRLRCVPSNSILIDFLNEDWSFLFPNADDTERKYYVYYHIDPSSDKVTYSRTSDICETVVRFVGLPFYIGKGTGLRYKSMSGRSRAHVNRIKIHLQDNYISDHVCHILQDGLTEKEAFEIESKLICFFGCSSEFPNNKIHFHGKCGGALINSDTGNRPLWIQSILEKRILQKKPNRNRRNRKGTESISDN